MEELPQDLGLALEDSSLKHDSDEQGYISGSDMKIDICRRRKMRKRRTTDILFQNGQCNPNGQLNNSPKSSSSVDESTRNSRYVESYTANCSEETDERPRHGPMHRNDAMRTVDRSHHKRVFKQAKPCYCESDSHNENAPIFPRKQRKKKFRKIVIDCNDSILVPERSEMKSRSHCQWKTRRKERPHTVDGTAMSKTSSVNSKNLNHYWAVRKCDACSTKSCSAEQMSCHHDGQNTCFEGVVISSNDSGVSCTCRCHINVGKDDSSLSGSSCNSDTDSANFTPDDIGGDGDDEMTDFYAESDGGSVLGIPHQSCNHWILRNGNTLRDEKLWLYGMGKIKSGENMYTGGMSDVRTDMSRSVDKQNKYSKNIIRYGQRHKRRMKIKKNKVKNLKEQDVSQMNKLSLGNRSKRMRLEGIKNSNIPHGHGVSATISFKEDAEMPSEDGNRKW